MAVNPTPDGYPSVMPYLSVDGAAEAIEFYKSVFGATERMRMPGSEGRVGHAEIEIGSGVVMLADASPQSGPEPKQLGGSPVSVMVYVPDVDAAYAAAIKAGAASVADPEDKFYGDRSAGFVDPWGHRWYVSTHIEDVEPEEMDRRMKEMMGFA
jgi:PhnB protein